MDNTELNNKIYKKHIILFLDIMGAKKLVYDNENNTKFLLLFKAIENIKKVNFSKIHLKGIKITCISDSIVITIPFSEKASFEKVIRVTESFINVFLEYGILLRGGITIGDIYHEDNIVFGPGLVEAYLLESECAIFPRLVIKEEILSEALKSCKSKIGENYTRENFKKDKDGMYFLDYLKDIIKLFSINPEKDTKIIKIRDFLIEKLKENYPTKIKMKYEWLKNYYNDVIKELGEENNLEYKDYLI